jgi:hypothetical protein
VNPLDSITNPFSDQAILALVAALGLSSTAGLRAVATLFAIGVVSDVNVNGHPLLALHGNFAVLGSTPVLIVLGVLTVVEILVDKFPVLDSLNDVIHTVIRPVVGAVIVAGTTNTLSDTNVWVAAGVGAVLAFSVHATKSTARVATTAATAGIGNPIVSTMEDVLAVGAILLIVAAKSVAILNAQWAPWVGLALLIIVLLVVLLIVLLAWRISLAIVRVFKPRREKPSAAMAGASIASTLPLERQPAE